MLGFTGLTKKCVFYGNMHFTVLKKNVFCGFGGKMYFFNFCGKIYFLVLAKKCMCKKKNLRFENYILTLNGHFCHLSFSSELDAPSRLTFI